MTHALDSQALDQLFRQARTHHAWLDQPVHDDTLRQLFALTIMGPTSVNCLPARFIFVRGQEAKSRLLPFLAPGNVEQTLSAPVTVIVGQDHDFPEQLPHLFPFADVRSWFAGDAAKISETALRNSSLQGAYLILAARALGLDTGAMSGFDNAGVDAAFFAGTQVRSNFLINLGYGDASKLYPRTPRPSFDEYAQIL